MFKFRGIPAKYKYDKGFTTMKQKMLSIILALSMLLSLGSPALAADNSPSNSQKYVEAMGQGWNLGNSFDGFNSDEGAVSDETSWGNPVVTRELIAAIKAKGFDSIRIPLTMATRWTEEGSRTVADTKWLARYKEVVDWAVEEGLYVMVNLHHDSWNWLSSWDGNEASAEYVRFVQLWEQLADYLKDEPEQVCFETINEPQFNDGTDEEKQAKLDAINLAAYHVIRESGGKNNTRMIVMPTLNTNHGNCAPLLSLMQSLHDENLIATVHYYSEWVYSANLGITGFDEALNDEGGTPRTAADSIMSTVYEAFTKNGIGVVVGEYGLLGYDKSENCDQLGEELKYYEYMNELSRKYGICLMFWDNGSAIDRRSTDYSWKKPALGAMLEASFKGRSSYVTGLNTLYFQDKVSADVDLPLTLNGNTFQGIEGLTDGTDYTYDSGKATVTLKADYINKAFNAAEGYGPMAELKLQFSSGSDWKEVLVKYAAPELGEATGTAEEGLTIPVTYNGAELRRITAYSGEEKTGPHSSWWKYLEHSYAYFVDAEAGTLTMAPSFFAECAEGEIKLVIEFYDGQIVEFTLNKSGDTVTAGKEASPEAVAFTDVKSGAWYQEAVNYVVSKGIMSGVTESVFAPETAMTREQMNQIVNSLGGMADSVSEDAPITRGEVVEALYRCTADPDDNMGDLSSYADAGNLSGSTLQAVRWAVGRKIITGRSGSILDLEGIATRAEIAVMIMRFCETA